MLNKEIRENEIIVTETESDDHERKESKEVENRRKYQAKYGQKIRYCEICDKHVKQFSFQNHIRSKTHKFKKEISDLRNLIQK